MCTHICHLYLRCRPQTGTVWSKECDYVCYRKLPYVEERRRECGCHKLYLCLSAAPFVGLLCVLLHHHPIPVKRSVQVAALSHQWACGHCQRSSLSRCVKPSSCVLVHWQRGHVGGQVGVVEKWMLCIL